MISVGIDISKGKSTVCILKPYGEIVCSPFDVQHVDKDLETLDSLLKKLDGEIRIVMEATGIYHLLFGGGGGLGAPYEPEHSTEQLLWVRSESHGRAVNTLDILEMPRPNQKFSWIEGLSFNAAQIFLYLKLLPDLTMEQTIGSSAAEWWKEKTTTPKAP